MWKPGGESGGDLCAMGVVGGEGGKNAGVVPMLLWLHSHKEWDKTNTMFKTVYLILGFK